MLNISGGSTESDLPDSAFGINYEVNKMVKSIPNPDSIPLPIPEPISEPIPELTSEPSPESAPKLE